MKMSKLVLLTTTLGAAILLSSGICSALDENKTQAVKTAKTIGLQNGFVNIDFDNETGALVSLKNMVTNDEYIKNSGGGNMFQSFFGVKPLTPAPEGGKQINPEDGVKPLTQVPESGKQIDPEDCVRPHTQVPEGGKKINPEDCKLIEHVFKGSPGGGQLKLLFSNEESKLDFQIVMDLGENNNYADCELSVINKGSVGQEVMTSFPYLSGISLGDKPETNLGIILNVAGSSGSKAWRNATEIYSLNWTMQFDAVYEPSLNEGLGLIVLDREFNPKTFGRSETGICGYRIFRRRF